MSGGDSPGGDPTDGAGGSHYPQHEWQKGRIYTTPTVQHVTLPRNSSELRTVKCMASKEDSKRGGKSWRKCGSKRTTSQLLTLWRDSGSPHEES